MTEERKCPHCGKPVPPTALGDICPECMLRAGFATQADAPDGTGPHGTKVIQPPPPPAEIAALFPQLEILEYLGRGGMGIVYKARQPRLNRLVALKILARDKEHDALFAERFAREAQALARLNHPNIVTVHDFGEAGGHCYLVMEFVDGVSLRGLLQTGRMKPEQALTIVPRVCEALQYAHEQGIVHRDIKPENILLDKAGRLKIADFGIAKIIGGDESATPPANAVAGAGAKGDESLTQNQVLGTPNYMAPEQVEKPQLVDHRADIYSLGVVFYEMLTGELPLGKFQPPSSRVRGIHVDVRLDEVVLHALEKEPERRYQHASVFKTDVETIARTPEGAGAPGNTASFASIRSRLRWPAAGLMLTGTLHFAFALLLLGFGILKLGGENAPPLAYAILLFISVLSLSVGALILAAASRMRRATSHGLACAGAVLAMISGPPALLGLPVGIWSLIVLTRREVRDAFTRNGARPDRTAKGAGWKIALGVTAGAMVVLAMVLMVVVPNSIRTPAKPGPREVIAQTLRHEIGRQLREAGANYDDLEVTVAIDRDSATPFKVAYRGLQNFKGPDGATPGADGEFVMEYIGGGQWQGELAGRQFTVSVGSRDNIDLPFVDDPRVIGEWARIDFVENPADFDPGRQHRARNFDLELTFLPDGRTAKPWFTWTKGVLIHHGDKTASHYQIRDIKGQTYMFLEAKSGDYTISGMKPRYHVLKKKG
jgi:tRNA A-37 threonylcarbamoyl transferase component Bud32